MVTVIQRTKESQDTLKKNKNETLNMVLEDRIAVTFKGEG